MPRKLPPIPIYEVPAKTGTLRARLSPDRSEFWLDYNEGGHNVTITMNAAEWTQLCDLRDILMPKRARKPKS